MKKIAFFVREITHASDPYFAIAKDLDIQLDIYVYDQVSFLSRDNKISFFIDNKPIKKFDLVLFRNVGKHIETQVILSQYFKSVGTIIFDPVFRYESAFLDRKSFEYLKLFEAGLPIIDSFFLSSKSVDLFKQQIEFPCIAKRTDGKQGEAVFLCKNKSELINLFDKHDTRLIVQPFIENDGDLRVLVVGGKVLGAIKRIAHSDEYRNNVSLGGRAEIFELTPELEKLALDSCKALKYSIAGIDLIFDKKSAEWKIIEVNLGPQFAGFMEATGINVHKKILSFLVKQIP